MTIASWWFTAAPSSASKARVLYMTGTTNPFTATENTLTGTVIGTPVTVGTSTIQDAPKSDQAPHIFTMSDGNLVACYFDGTNGGYRIKASGTWGAFTNFTTNPTIASSQVWTRNGNTLYGLMSAGGATGCQIRKLVYSAGAITDTKVATSGSGDITNVPNGIYWDTTNSYIHAWLWTNDVGAGIILRLEAWNASLVNQYTAVANIGNTNIDRTTIAGDTTSTFFISQAPNTTLSITKVVAGASSYTQTNETGVPVITSGTGHGSVYDGTNYLFFYTVTGAIKMVRRTAANTYDAELTLVTATVVPFMGVPIFRKGTGAASDLVVFFRNNTNQANGEIYYLRRVAGTWDASPGTLFAGGAATGFSNVSVAASDLNT